MIQDNYGYIEMEQDPVGNPGRTGDSLAETSRYVSIAYVIGDNPKINLAYFVTDKGCLRHPDSPWREDDCSGDQVFPLIAASALTQPELLAKVLKQIKDAGYKTGNGDFITPGMLGQIRRAEDKKFLAISDIPLVIQAVLFKIPFRWSDSKKKFESNDDSSGDYLNFINTLAFAKAKGNISLPMKLAMKLISKEKCLEKVKHYYRNEPNSQGLVELYEKSLGKIYAL